MSDAAAFGLWVGAGAMASVTGLLLLRRVTHPRRRVWRRRADGSSPEGEVRDPPRTVVGLESASGPLDR